MVPPHSVAAPLHRYVVVVKIWMMISSDVDDGYIVGFVYDVINEDDTIETESKNVVNNDSEYSFGCYFPNDRISVVDRWRNVYETTRLVTRFYHLLPDDDDNDPFGRQAKATIVVVVDAVVGNVV